MDPMHVSLSFAKVMGSNPTRSIFITLGNYGISSFLLLDKTRQQCQCCILPFVQPGCVLSSSLHNRPDRTLILCCQKLLKLITLGFPIV
jgi:hypothetical protein